MIIGAFADSVIEELGYKTSKKDLDRRTVILRTDVERSELLTAGVYSATKIVSHYSGGGGWQYNIGEDLKELPGALFISKTSDVQYDCERDRYFSVMPTEWVYFKGQSGIRLIRGIKDNTADRNQALNFIKQETGAGVAYGLLPSANLLGQVGFEIEGTTIWYNNMQPNTYKKVLITYLPKLIGLLETDAMPCSAEFEAMLMDKVKESLTEKRQTPQNNIVDSEK